MTEEDEEFNRIEREVAMKQRKYDDDDIQEYVRPWVGLTDDERKLVRNSVGYNQFMTAGEYAELVQKATESLLKVKNEM